jgi:hypothetical protein
MTSKIAAQPDGHRGGVMNFATKSLPEVLPLRRFAKSCYLAMRDNVELVPYPTEVLQHDCQAIWSNYRNEIDQALEPLLAEVAGRAGVYALCTQDKRGTIRVKYIGQAKADGMRSRFRAHLINKNKVTGSQLARVKQHCAAGMSMGFSFVEVRPAEIREYVEAWMIDRVCPDWNFQGIARKRLEGPGGPFNAKNRAWHLAGDD